MSVSQVIDRRRAERKIANRPITLVVDADSDQISKSAFAVDLSDLGAKIRASIKLTPGQRVTLLPNGGAGSPVPSCVIWVGPESLDHSTEAGLAFLQPMVN